MIENLSQLVQIQFVQFFSFLLIVDREVIVSSLNKFLTNMNISSFYL